MPKNKFARFFIDLILALIVLAGGFAITLSVAPTWGATPEEASRAYPGDEINTGRGGKRRRLSANFANFSNFKIQLKQTAAFFVYYSGMKPLIIANFTKFFRVHSSPLA